jgi:hypothetical protein
LNKELAMPDTPDTPAPFTPGPWKVSGFAVLTDIGDFREAMKRSQYVTIRKICDCTPNPNYVPEAEALANAHLIAAAPDLLAALQMFMDVAGNDRDEVQEVYGTKMAVAYAHAVDAMAIAKGGAA